jgi:hypothetical protein
VVNVNAGKPINLNIEKPGSEKYLFARQPLMAAFWFADRNTGDVIAVYA